MTSTRPQTGCRVVSEVDQNLRVNVDTGATTVDGDLVYAGGDEKAGRNPWVTATAYTNNQPGAFNNPSATLPVTGQTTTLYDVDPGPDILTTQNPPSDGRSTPGAVSASTPGSTPVSMPSRPGAWIRPTPLFR